MDDRELGELVRFVVDELAPAAYLAGGGELDLADPLHIDVGRPDADGLYATLASWSDQLRVVARRGDEGRWVHHPAGQAAQVCDHVRMVVVRWSGEQAGAMRSPRVLDEVHWACRAAGRLFDDPVWVLRVRLVAAGVPLADALAAADTAVR